MKTIIFKTAYSLANILVYGTVNHVIEESMAENERGFSEDKVVRKKYFLQMEPLCQ